MKKIPLLLASLGCLVQPLFLHGQEHNQEYNKEYNKETTKTEIVHETASQENPVQETKKEAAPRPPYFADDDDEKKEAQVEQPHFSELLSRMLIMLVVTVGGFALFAWFAKKFLHNRMQGLNRQGRIQIVEQRALSQKSALYIIKIDAKEYLITESASGIDIKDL
jgi:hypothetical protein